LHKFRTSGANAAPQGNRPAEAEPRVDHPSQLLAEERSAIHFGLSAFYRHPYDFRFSPFGRSAYTCLEIRRPTHIHLRLHDRPRCAIPPVLRSQTTVVPCGIECGYIASVRRPNVPFVGLENLEACHSCRWRSRRDGSSKYLALHIRHFRIIAAYCLEPCRRTLIFRTRIQLPHIRGRAVKQGKPSTAPWLFAVKANLLPSGDQRGRFTSKDGKVSWSFSVPSFGSPKGEFRPVYIRDPLAIPREIQVNGRRPCKNGTSFMCRLNLSI